MNKKITAGIGAGLALLGGGTLTADQIANPYNDKGAVMELRASSTIPFSGDVVAEVVKDRPEVRLKKWDDVTLSVRHDDVKAKGDRKFMTDKIEWKQGKKEVHAYPLEATEQMEDGGIEFEVVLNEKPDTNVFDFQIDGAENLDFFYQGELTPEDIAEGVERPENVIGSYAVYHKTKRDHVIGGTNYATGKVFHIFRPKAIDANGVEMWGTLSYTNGVLSVTVPQDFLDTATYPVKVDPTFGYTGLGGTTSANVRRSSSGATLNTNRMAYEASPSSSGTLDSISIYLGASTGSHTVTMSTFLNVKDGGGVGSHTQTATVEQDKSFSTTPSWYTFSAGGQSVGASSVYLISASGDPTDLASDADINRYIDSGVVTPPVYIEQYSGAGSYTSSKESPWVNSGNEFNDSRLSIYATFTELPPSTPQSIIWFD